MAQIRIEIDLKGGTQVGRTLKRNFEQFRGRVINAAHVAARQAAQEILVEGRADISQAGKFGARWTEGLQAAEDFGPDSSLVTIFHTVPYWRIFEVGGTIRGKPLLWIPLSFSDAVGKNARDYGPLFRVDRKSGAPLLLSKADKKPKYFGKPSVLIPKKFHLTEIARAVAGRLKDFYKAAFNR